MAAQPGSTVLTPAAVTAKIMVHDGAGQIHMVPAAKCLLIHTGVLRLVSQNNQTIFSLQSLLYIFNLLATPSLTASAISAAVIKRWLPRLNKISMLASGTPSLFSSSTSTGIKSKLLATRVVVANKSHRCLLVSQSLSTALQPTGLLMASSTPCFDIRHGRHAGHAHLFSTRLSSRLKLLVP